MINEQRRRESVFQPEVRSIAVPIPRYDPIPRVKIDWGEVVRAKTHVKRQSFWDIKWLATLGGVALSVLLLPPAEDQRIAASPTPITTPYIPPEATPGARDSQVVHIFNQGEIVVPTVAVSPEMVTPSPTPSIEISASELEGYNLPPVNEAVWLEAVNAARRVEDTTGIPASDPLAQALHESGFFSSLAGRFNPLGIMVSGRGKNFGSYEEAFSDYGRFVSGYSRVKSLINAESHNPKDFLLAISQSGYAADPAYFGKVLAIHERYQLAKYNLEQS